MELWVDGNTLLVSRVGPIYFKTLQTFKVLVTVSTVINKGFAKGETC